MNRKSFLALLMALAMLLGMTAVAEPVPSPEAEEVLSTAFLMYADANWNYQWWHDGSEPANGVKVTEVAVTGEGKYTVGLDFTETPDGAASGIAFAAVGLDQGEKNMPGWDIRVDEIRVNGEAIALTKGYTSSDDKVVTRSNIYNEWVGELPSDARSWDGSLDGASAITVDKAAFESVKTIEVDFTLFQYGEAMAYIMFADGGWTSQYWGSDDSAVKATNVNVTKPGDYTVALDFTATEAGVAEGLSFTALGLKNGEKVFPGMFLKINDIRLNGESIAFTKGYTSSDDQVETRMNIMNEWVSELPADARSWDKSTEDASWIIVDKALFTGVKTYEVDFTLVPKTDTAFLMFADSNWATSAWNAGEYADTNAVEVNGPGTYTVSLDFSGVEGGAIPGVAFMAVGIANGETTFPGYFIDVTEIKVNGTAIDITPDFTTSDEGVVTRSNIWNEWVTEIPDAARTADGNLEGVSAQIATAEALSNITTIDVTFDYIYGEPPAVEEDQPLTEDEVNELISKTYGAYIAVQSNPNYIFRNDWEDSSYGRDADNGVFATLAKTNGDGTVSDYGATFFDAEITGNGTYTCGMTTGEMGFGDDTGFFFFRVATDIPAKLVKEGYVTISDVTVKIGDGKTQSGVLVDDSGDWVKLVVADEYNKVYADGVVLTVPGPNTTVTFTFTVSGLAN